MSYIPDINRNTQHNPINELNTDYLNAPDSSTYKGINKQQMYTNEPISQYDNEALDSYRSTIEQLRTKTESMNMALESALVPSIFYGSSIMKKDRYISQDKVFIVDKNKPEYVFKCNMIKFKSDRKKRLCYSTTLNEYTLPEDTIESVLERLNKKYKDVLNVEITYDMFIKANPKLRRYEYDMDIDEGILIDTTIPSTMYNLIKYDYIHPFLGFMNNMAIPWDCIKIFNDNCDTYVIIDASNFDNSRKPGPEDIDNSTFIYLDIPFNIKYVRPFETLDTKFENKTPIFWFNEYSGMIRSDSDFEDSVRDNNQFFRNGIWWIRIYLDDDSVIYEEFLIDQDELKTGFGYISKFGILYNKRFTDFDYRCKIKRFNLLCFEDPNYKNYAGKICDDFQVESHQFNILKITLDKVNNNRRRFKIFYNTKVLYDQDNIFRFKNKDYLSDKFFKYLKDINSNVQVFINEIYKLIERDTEDVYKLRTEIVSFNNMEEGSTPTDEFIYYINYDTRDILRELAYQIFQDDQDIILNTINELIDRAYIDNYNKVNPSTGKSPKNEWFIRKNLAEMFRYSINELEYPFSNMLLLDEVFDFTYKDNLSYEENLNNAAEYIVGYDMDKLEATINRNIISITKSGAELNSMIDNTGKITMSRWYNNRKNSNYVIIFHNGKLYSRYYTITYDKFSFTFDTLSSYYPENDEFEFVFFMNVNNNVIETQYKTIKAPVYKTSKQGALSTQDILAIPCNTNLFEPENLLVLTDKIPNNTYNVNINFNNQTTRYPLNYQILSYNCSLNTSNDVTMYLQQDTKVNGSYRVTKQNNEEYFIKLSTTDNFNDTNLKGSNISICSSRQFRYKRTVIGAGFNNNFIPLTDSSNKDFRYCINPDQLLVFVNNTVLPKTYVYLRSVNNTPVDKPELCLNISLKIGDVVDIFYIPNTLEYMNTKIQNSPSLITDKITKISPSGYIKFYAYQTYAKNSKYSILLFINGKKIPMSKMEDITTNMIKVLTDQKSDDRLEVYNFVDTTDLDKIYIKDGLSHNNDYDKNPKIDISNYITKNSLLDDIVGNASYDNLNIIFDNYAHVSNIENTLYPDYLTKNNVLQKIIENYVTSTDINKWIANL